MSFRPRHAQAPDEAAILKVNSLTAGYGDNRILNAVDLSFERDVITTIIGPNGAGKSTLLKAIMGYIKPSSGTVEYNGNKLAKLKPSKRIRLGMSYVPQLANVFSSLTVEENLVMGSFSLGKSLARKRASEQFERFPILAKRRKQRASTMSGGERQMLAMARALMTDPGLLLLDEPSAALSPAISKQVFEKIEEIQHQGKTVLIVEQSAEISLAISKKCVVLVNGQNVLEAPADEILTDSRLREAYLGA